MPSGVGRRPWCLLAVVAAVAAVATVAAATAVSVVPARAAVAATRATRAPAAPAAPAASATLDPSRYVSLTPSRIYDSGRGAVGTTPVRVTMPSSVPSTATAVVIDLTGDRPSTSTNVAAYPSGTSPTTSALNLGAGTTSTGLVTVPLPSSAAGTVLLRNAAGTVRLVVDLVGYYTASGAGASFVAVQPFRAYDSNGHAPLGTSPAVLTAAQLGVPAAASVLVANLVADRPTASTNLTVWTAGTSKPPVSNLNIAKGDARGNLVTVALGAGGAGIELVSAAGSMRYVVDVEGWYSTTATGALYTPLAAPVRVFGSGARPSVGTTPFDLGLPAPVPSSAAAAAFTLIAAHASTGTNVAAYLPGSTPTTTALNVDAGVDTPNLVVASLGRSSAAVTANATSLSQTAPSATAVRFANAAGTVQLIVDLQGWFVPNTPGHDVSYAQCDGSSTNPSPLPATSFGIINPTAQGLAGSGTSPCLAAQESWAAGSGDEELYLPLVDHGYESSLYRAPPVAPRSCPSGQTQAQYDANAGCAYDYGYNQAMSAYGYAGSTPAPTRWWLDVEAGDAGDNFTDTETSGSTTTRTALAPSQNVAVIQGASDYLTAQGATVGLYSNTDAANWPAITGGSTAFSGLPEWFSSHAASALGAVRTCSTPFAGGTVVIAQVAGTGGALDTDFRC